MAGDFVFLCNKEKECMPIHWKAKTIRKVCKSTKTAETRAAEQAVDDSIYLGRMLHEMYSGKPGQGQLPADVFVDAQSLLDSIGSTKQVEEKTVRHVIASFKQNVEDKEIRMFDWVSTKEMYADILTKSGVKPDFVLEALETGCLKRTSQRSQTMGVPEPID